LGIPPAIYNDQLEVWPLRGQLRSLPQLSEDFAAIQPDEFKLIVLDAKYRFYPQGQSENDNAAEASLYNLIDHYAQQTGAAFDLVHHSSKGTQGDKRVTDVGAGAGAQSRAADCHLILREHEEPGVVVLDAAVRSFAPVEPLPLRWEFPLWVPVHDIDASKLKGRLSKGEQKQAESDKEGTADILAALQDGPATASQLRKSAAMGPSRLDRLIGLLMKAGKVGARPTSARGNDCDEYYIIKT
jgi:hypothetical protein